LHRLELIGIAATHSDVSCITSLDDIMECLHGLFDWSIGVESMALKYIDVFEVKTLQGFFDGSKNMLSR
jgi:hypothetical protein